MKELTDNRRRLAALAGWLVVMVVASTAVADGPTTAAGDEVPVEAVDGLAEQVERLEETYLMPAVLEDQFRVETRFNEGKVAYMLEDYERASILLVAVIDATEVQEFDSYREALYLLGDTLYQMRKYRAAREYFREVVDEGPGPFYQAAIVELLELAAELEDYGEVDALYQRLDDLEEVSPTLHYTRGKTLYQQGQPDAARPWFQRAARDDDYELTARYFEGVALAADGQLSEADSLFEDLTRMRPSDARGEEIVELAHLARGRLAYEEGRYERAIDHYLQVPRGSAHFTRGLYELTWALVAQGNYESALRNLDILLISDPDPRFVPEAQSLMADMAMRIGDYDEARSWFGELVDTFVPVRRELQDFIDEHEELDEFFVGLVREELEGLEPDFLPDKVTEWVEDEELMQKSRQLMADGTATQEDIDQIYDTIDEIEETIEMGSSIEVFPRLSEGWTQGMELEARLVDVEEQLLDWELRQVRPMVSPAQEEKLQEIEEELQELQRREERAPRSREDIEERDQRIREQLQTLEEELDRVAFEIESLEETLEGIGEYVSRGADRWTDEERREVAEVRRELRDELGELQQEREQLARHLRQTERAFGARDESLVEYRELRQEIQQLQAERAEIVDAQADAVDPERRREFNRVAEARRRLPEVQDRLSAYFDELDELVDDRLAGIRATLDAERSNLASYQAELEDWNSETEQRVAELAMYNFVEVDREFETLVRRGRVGLVDVDWQQLDDAAETRRELEDEKLETEEMLREAFPDVD